jgi:hypothetical protein
VLQSETRLGLDLVNIAGKLEFRWVMLRHSAGTCKSGAYSRNEYAVTACRSVGGCASSRASSRNSATVSRGSMRAPLDINIQRVSQSRRPACKAVTYNGTAALGSFRTQKVYRRVAL